MGIVGGLVIANWSSSLMNISGASFSTPSPEARRCRRIRERIETEDDRITDLHVWQVGPGHRSAIVCVLTREPSDPAFTRAGFWPSADELSHVTVEVTRARRLLRWLRSIADHARAGAG